MSKLQTVDILIKEELNSPNVNTDNLKNALINLYSYLNHASFLQILFNWRKIVRMLKDVINLIVEIF